eukprot:scaffold12276_cov122-Isochrysis_galbana.AAC.2
MLEVGSGAIARFDGGSSEGHGHGQAHWGSAKPFRGRGATADGGIWRGRVVGQGFDATLRIQIRRREPFDTVVGQRPCPTGRVGHWSVSGYNWQSGVSHRP